MSIQPSTGDLGSCCEVQPPLLGPHEAAEQSIVFKALADPVRLRLLGLIAANADGVCVCDLVAAFELTQPTISHHLKVLREAGLLASERRGTWIYYWLRADALANVRHTLDLLDAVRAPA